MIEQTDEDLMELVQRQHQLVEAEERAERELEEMHEKLEWQALQQLHRVLALHADVEVEHPKYAGNNHRRKPIGTLYELNEKVPQLVLFSIGAHGPTTTMQPEYCTTEQLVRFVTSQDCGRTADRLTFGQAQTRVIEWLLDLQRIPGGS